MKAVLMLLALILCLPVGVVAEQLPVGSGMVLQFELPGPAWSLYTEAPEFLVEEGVEHAQHELAEQGRQVTREQLLPKVRERLAANEGYLCNPVSQSCLVIDFSPLAEGEMPPRRRSIAASARMAGEGLTDEEGISEAQAKTRKISLPGASHTYRLDASYRHHGEPRTLVGLIGFSPPNWFYLYYTDTHRNPDDLPQFERMLKGVSIRPGAGN